MSELELDVKPRVRTGKGAAHQLRRDGWVPGSLYGPGMSLSVQVERKALERMLRTEGATTRLVQVRLEAPQGDDGAGGERKVLIREIQRDPVSREILHIDLYAVPMDRAVRASVPVLIEGIEELERRGYVPAVGEREVEVECLPTAIPPYFTADVSKLEPGEGFLAGGLSIPDGIRLLTQPETVLVRAVVPRQTAEEQAPAATAEATPAEPERVTKKPKEAEQEES